MLGPGRTILDGSRTWAGAPSPRHHGSRGGSHQRVVAALRAPTRSTPTAGLDFASADDCNVASPYLTLCESCTRFVCAPIPTGGACEDSDPCAAERSATRRPPAGGSPTSCDGSTSAADSCDPSGCVHAPTTGVTCDDASACGGVHAVGRELQHGHRVRRRERVHSRLLRSASSGCAVVATGQEAARTRTSATVARSTTPPARASRARRSNCDDGNPCTRQTPAT
ncbi:MAG: hypothetical protein M5U28_46530 [Sandaracinaceae bacterium]|nr:hypothetical protein [Sandaracinaceae bacterium]